MQEYQINRPPGQIPENLPIPNDLGEGPNNITESPKPNKPKKRSNITPMAVSKSYASLIREYSKRKGITIQRAHHELLEPGLRANQLSTNNNSVDAHPVENNNSENNPNPF